MQAKRWRWLILASVGLSLLWVEVQEFMVLRVLDQPFHYFEVFQYAVLLISTGTLIELYSRSNTAHRQALRILEYKHALSIELTAHDDWDLLAKKLAELPSRIAEVDEAYLLVGNPLNEKLEIASHWEGARETSDREAWDPTIPCPACLEKKSGSKINFHLCRSTDRAASSYLTYSLGMVDQDSNQAVLKFRLATGARLMEDERAMFVNIGDEIAVALRASRNLRRIMDLQSAQVAMAERRTVSGYVHDQLGQNLGYLHLKLDQLGNRKALGKSRDLYTELHQLQSVANESYEIVRDILKRIQPDTIPHLTNILREHSRKIASRAGFHLNFRSVGRPVSLLPEAQQLVLYVFYEVFNNIEKHARAEQVTVHILWRKSYLDISVSDDGVGFDAKNSGAEGHFGLKILHERVAKLNGCLAINSSSAGTTFLISIPLIWTKGAQNGQQG